MTKALRRHIEMQPLDLERGWEALPGFPDGLEVKVLADDLNELRKTGARTRLVRFAPGAATVEALIHDYWEEVFLLNGELAQVGHQSPVAERLSYSCRPPGTPHGPFISAAGCVMFELQYYGAGTNISRLTTS